jgi:hypothetical protein
MRRNPKGKPAKIGGVILHQRAVLSSLTMAMDVQLLTRAVWRSNLDWKYV